jgi:ATP-dependent DNA helicase DinG
VIGEARISRGAAATIKTAIKLAGGNEVCFVSTLDADGIIQSARVVARGDIRSVLALPGVAQRGDMFVHNHPSGLLEPSDADLEIAARVHSNGVGFAIVDNDATRLYVVTEVPAPAKNSAIALDALDETLGPDGPIAADMRANGSFGYEDRPSQRAMAKAVAKAFNHKGIALLEAGTGVGKSLGYLVPALRWAAGNDERTIVSTATITLQEQLVNKDLPFLAGALHDQEVRFALLKGWRNYVCLQRLEQATASGASLFDEAGARELETIVDWTKHTADGTIADLATPPRPDVWDEVAAEPDLCGRLKCPHYDKCFLFEARKQASLADVVVVNHHLLLADVAVRRAANNWDDAAVLPSYKRVIIDEGHHLEDAASSHLGVSVTRRGMVRLFGRLERRGNKGLLPVLAARLAATSDLLSTASLDLVRERLAPSTHRARELAQRLFDQLQQLLESLPAAGALRLDEGFQQHRVWRDGLDATFTDLLREVSLINDGLRLVRERIESDEKKAEELSTTIGELRGVGRRLEGAADSLVQALRPAAGGDPMVRWLELSGKPGPDRNVAAHAVPLDLAPILRADLFDRVETAIVTSATLATNGGFDFLRERLGLSEEPPVSTAAADSQPAPKKKSRRSVHTDVFPSPFDYARQALLAIPTDLPAPNENPSGHADAVHRQLRDLVRAADGGVFGLFTSHRDLRAAATWWREEGLDARWPLLVHGEDEARDVLLKRFRDAGRAVLFGTASFWEGVDVPGRALRALLISKLPFRVPSEPVVAAQCEAIEARGGNPFVEYMLPHASLRLKQGFGRLVRTASDRGVVVISDPRVITKRYGRGLLDALPPARRISGAWSGIHSEIRSFFEHDTNS